MQIDRILCQRPIQPEELEYFRGNLKIGAFVWLEIEHLDMESNRFFQKKKTKVRVVEKYPHVVVTKDTRTEKEYHTTYVELLLQERRVQYGKAAL